MPSTTKGVGVRSGDHLLLSVSRADGSTVVVEEFSRTEPGPPLGRRRGRHRRRRADAAPRERRLLALPVLVALFASTSALASSPDPNAVPVRTGVERVVPLPGTSPAATDPPVAELDLRPEAPETADAVQVIPDPTVPKDRVITDPIERCRPLAGGSRFTVEDPVDRNLLAQMIHDTFECVVAAGGLDDTPATENRRWNGVEAWGFESLAEQVAAEAVVVGYCESLGFRQHALERNNPWGYGGIFQMGTTEMKRFGPHDGNKFDAVDNTLAAANYFLWGLERGHPWGGWGPWAVVNTDFDDVNDHVLVPVLPRFASTDPTKRGRTGPELPAWAVDPWGWTVPAWGGCPAMVGWSWPEAQPLG